MLLLHRKLMDLVSMQFWDVMHDVNMGSYAGIHSCHTTTDLSLWILFPGAMAMCFAGPLTRLVSPTSWGTVYSNVGVLVIWVSWYRFHGTIDESQDVDCNTRCMFHDFLLFQSKDLSGFGTSTTISSYPCFVARQTLWVQPCSRAMILTDA